ncbi:hypothetical protein T265_05557 [Opisthorchis viverrini]|uniref:Uncharacterized protein n=1 Tax=Opisthorchis viverrini TaxID=6198 RepID=A0A074ZVH7_OPIVI|nr:hypothetical protein T265_05557 [Opisthorchis viverrini]KER27380.1 hypothetical protein T265_05557 [Opisthorchis viverrini]
MLPCTAMSSGTADELKERVRLLQRELEFKRKLLKKVERKHMPTTGKILLESNALNDQIDSQVSLEASTPKASIQEHTPQSCGSLESLECVDLLHSDPLLTCSSLQHETSVVVHLLAAALDSHELILFYNPKGSNHCPVVWRKKLISDVTTFIRILTPPSSGSCEAAFGLVVGELFESSSSHLVTLYQFSYVTTCLPFIASLVDVSTLPLPNPHKLKSDRCKSLHCTIFGSFDSKIWISLFLPESCCHVLLEVFDARFVWRLSDMKTVDLGGHQSLSNWSTSISACSIDGKNWALVGIHSDSDSGTWLYHQWRPGCFSGDRESEFELLLMPIKLATGLHVTRTENLVFRRLSAVALERDSARTLLSVVADAVSESGTKPILLVAVASDKQCLVLRVSDLTLPQYSSQPAIWLLLQLKDSRFKQTIIGITPAGTIHCHKLQVSTWSVSSLLEPCDTVVYPNTCTVSIGTDFKFGVLPLVHFDQVYSLLSPLLVTCLFNDKSLTFSLVCNT